MSLTVGDYKIDLSTIYGSGAQAKVVRGNHVVSNETVAIKVFALKTKSSKMCFENEAVLLKLCQKHENIIPARSCFVHKQFGFLVMPQVKSDLLSLIMDTPGFEETETVPLFQQICSGIHYCHEQNVAHLDIKPENILVDKNNKIYICDFGNSHLFKNDELVNIGRRGTLVYCAPEVKVKGNVYDPIKADIWSLGILLHVILAGYFPHSEGEKEMEDFHKGFVNLEFIRDSITPICFDLLVRMLNIIPGDRPTIPEILQHPWMGGNKEKSSIAQKISKKIRGNR